MLFKLILFLLAGAAWGAGPAAPRGSEAEALLREALELPSKSYEGELSVVSWQGGRTETRTLRVRFSPPGKYRREVVDAAGKPLLSVVSDGESEWVHDTRRGLAWKGEAADAYYKLMGPQEEAELLRANYEARLSGSQTVAGRRARVLEVFSKRDGRLARRLWVDKDGLVLARAAYGPDGAETSSMRFTRLQSPGTAREEDFTFSPPPGVRVLAGRWNPDYMELDEAAAASGLNPRTPGWLPSGFVFESVNLLPHRGKTLLHTRFSDGIVVFSLFQCPKGTRLRMGGPDGGKPFPLAGAKARLSASPEGKVLEWSDQDRFVLIGPLPEDELRKIAESMRAK